MQQYTQQVEAVQVSPENIDQIIQWMNGMGESQKDHKGRYMIISIQNGFGVAGEGQWIVKDRFGIYNVYHDDTFKTLYHLTPPSEAEGQGCINIPIKIIETLIYYGHIHTVGGVQPVDMKSHKDTIWEAIEWLHQNCDIIDGERRLKSHPAPSGPVEGPWRAGVTDHEKESALIEYLGGKPTLTPVEADFETALEAECCKLPYTKLIDHHRVEGFEMGAKWARQYLSSIPDTPGPWHLKSHANTEDDDTVWATDGKMSFYIDEFNFDDFPEADYWLVNFLNKYRFKLSIDESHQIVISHLEEQIAHLKSQQAGATWVRATERTPSDHKYKFVKIEGTMSMCRWRKDSQLFMDEDADFFPPDQVEWLDDSPAPEQVDPELIAAYKEYVQLLNDECSELVVMATLHGWKSTRYEKGVELREKIEALQNRTGGHGS